MCFQYSARFATVQMEIMVSHIQNFTKHSSVKVKLSSHQCGSGQTNSHSGFGRGDETAVEQVTSCTQRKLVIHSGEKYLQQCH